MRRLCETKLSWIRKTINNLNRLNSTGLQVKIKQLLNLIRDWEIFPKLRVVIARLGSKNSRPHLQVCYWDPGKP